MAHNLEKFPDSINCPMCRAKAVYRTDYGFYVCENEECKREYIGGGVMDAIDLAMMISANPEWTED